MALPETLWNVNKDLLTDAINGKSYKVMLTSAAIDGETADNISDLTEISAGNGYSAGGPSTTVTVGQDESAAFLIASQPTLTASGGDIGPYIGIAVYEVGSGALRGIWNESGATTITNGSSLTPQFNQSSGFLHWGSVDP